MTFIVVPHGGRDLSTRSFEISYRRLRLVGVALVVAAALWLIMAASWTWFFSQAARIPGMRAEIERLEDQQDRVTQLAGALTRLERQYDQVRAMLGADVEGAAGSIWLPPVGADGTAEMAPADSIEASLPNAWPLTERGFITREHLGRIPGEHPGIDIAVAEGSYIRAAGSGEVIQATEDPIYGRYVRIRHAGGYETVYGHASELLVAQGDFVERYELIALSGNTGTSTAPHLHFEIWRDGAPIDPLELVSAPG